MSRFKLTEWDKCVLYLAERGGWVKAYEMGGKPFSRGFVGAQADRRMYDVMQEVKERGFYQIGETRYFIEDGKEGKFKTYRVSGVSKPEYWVKNPITGEKITTDQYATL